MKKEKLLAFGPIEDIFTPVGLNFNNSIGENEVIPLGYCVKFKPEETNIVFIGKGAFKILNSALKSMGFQTSMTEQNRITVLKPSESKRIIISKIPFDDSVCFLLDTTLDTFYDYESLNPFPPETKGHQLYDIIEK